MSELSDSFHVGGEVSVVFDYRDTYASGVASDTIAMVRHMAISHGKRTHRPIGLISDGTDPAELCPDIERRALFAAEEEDI